MPLARRFLPSKDSRHLLLDILASIDYIRSDLLPLRTAVEKALQSL